MLQINDLSGFVYRCLINVQMLIFDLFFLPYNEKIRTHVNTYLRKPFYETQSDDLPMSELDQIITVLKGGGTILYPTDTIWALGCDATSAKAVEKIRRIKEFRTKEPMIVLVDSIDMLHRHVIEVHPRIETLISYHQRPLTVMYDRCRYLASNVMNEDGAAAIRVTLDPFCRELVSKLGRPLVAYNAQSQEVDSPMGFSDVDPHILENVDYIVHYKQDQTIEKYPSVIVKLTDRAELDFIRE